MVRLHEEVDVLEHLVPERGGIAVGVNEVDPVHPMLPGVGWFGVTQLTEVVRDVACFFTARTLLDVVLAELGRESGRHHDMALDTAHREDCFEPHGGMTLLNREPSVNRCPRRCGRTQLGENHGLF